MEIDYQLILHEGALDDLHEGYLWYKDRSSRAAERFTSAFDHAIRRIQENPLLHPAPDKFYRQCSMGRFPFKIVFRMDNSRVMILAVLHHARDPEGGRKVLESRSE